MAPGDSGQAANLYDIKRERDAMYCSPAALRQGSEDGHCALSAAKTLLNMAIGSRLRRYLPKKIKAK
jgi:hypothetical protein